ncbi:MAG TPA: winged helix-turn-helix transcriptional regulator, partial [Halobacteriales archaeon]|nr:winged helix-turn-helix transcriptional regulator [Halobacteriales archaeon]
DLQEKGLVERTVVDERPVHVEYALTEHGQGLSAAVEELERWGREYLREATAPEESII